MITIFFLVLLGAFSGFIAGLLGVGGGLIIVPALLYLLADVVVEASLMHTAIGTALATIVFTSVSSVWSHQKHGAIHWYNFKKLTPTVLLGAFSGAIIARYLSFDFLKFFFVFFELLVALRMWFGAANSSQQIKKLTYLVWAISGYIIGFVSSIVGIGGGIMTTPFLVYNNVNIRNAIATSAAIGMPISIAGALGFIVAGWGVDAATFGLGFINTKALFSIAATSILFAPLGARATHRVDAVKLKKIFAIFLGCIGFMVIIF